MPAVTSAVEIILADPALKAIFLLRNAARGGEAALVESKAARFLLWFALDGRRTYQHVAISPACLAFLSAPLPPYVSRLAAYVLLQRSDVRESLGSDLDRFHAWYYADAVREYGLAMFITAREQHDLLQPHPRFANLNPSLSRAAYYTLLRDKTLRRRFEAEQERPTPEFRASLSEATTALFGGWLPVPPLADRSGLDGVNIIGFSDGVLGIGEDARALTAVVSRAGIPRAIYNVALPDKTATSARYGTELLNTDRPLFPVNIFALTAFETARLHVERGENLFHGRYNIGYWPWELTSLPEHWRFVFDLVDEVWASSEFLLDVYRRLTDKPVFLMPPYLNTPEVTPVDLVRFGLYPEDIVFLTMFDFNSYVARKNPHAAIAAFERAFPDRSGPERLLIKTLNAESHPDAFAELERRLGDDDRYVLIDGPLSRGEVCGLIAAVDCFVSLHRSEGFGRVVAEAMLLRTTVIATDWSGSASFLDATRGYPVDYTLRPVAPDEYVFWEGSDWAEPSLPDAADKLRRARDNLAADGPMRRRASAFVDAAYGLDPVAAGVAARLEQIAATRSGRR